MRNLLISEIFPPKKGGSGRWFYELYRRFPTKTNVLAVGEDSLQDHFDGTHDLNLVRIPLSMHSWGITSLSELKVYTKALRRLSSLVKKQRISQIHCGRCLPEGLLALALRYRYGIPYICYIHGEDVSCAATSREYTWLTRRILSNASVLLANSRNTYHILATEWRIPSHKISLLYPGVDTKRFTPAAPDILWKRKLGWENRPVVLTVGRLEKRKGQDHMIQAMVKLRHLVPGILYAIIGDGEERSHLQDLVETNRLQRSVTFLGAIDDNLMIKCYQQCDLFVLPNRTVGRNIEGFGMVLVEAQACGKPVIAGASGGTQETMKPEHTGRIVNCENVNTLAASVHEMLNAPDILHRMGLQARQWVLDHFDWASLADKATNIFITAPSKRFLREQECVSQ